MSQACSDNALIDRTIEDVLSAGRQGFQTVIEAIAKQSDTS